MEKTYPVKVTFDPAGPGLEDCLRAILERQAEEREAGWRLRK